MILGLRPVLIRRLVSRCCPDVGGRFLRFREVVTVWLICRSFVSAVSVAAQVAALLRLPLRAGAILVILVSLFSRCDSSVVAMGSMSFL